VEKTIQKLVEKILGVPVQVTREEANQEVVFTILIPGNLTGRIVGKKGRIIKALRTVLALKASKEKLPYRWRLEVSSLPEEQ